MPLVNERILSDRTQEKRALAGALNTTNPETMIPTLNVIEHLGLSNFIQVTPTNAQLSGYDYIHEIVKCHADKMNVPIGPHLDHGKTQEDVKQTVRVGFTSIIINGAASSLEKNIAFTQEAVDLCKPHDVPAETELGAIPGKEDDHVSEADCKTEPEKAKTFVECTGCDMSAVPTGNVHDSDDIPWIDTPLLKCIAEVSPVSLVIHGDLGIAPGILRSFANYRVAKVNVVSDLRKMFIIVAGKAYMNNHSGVSLAQVMASAKNVVEEDVYSKIPTTDEGHRLGR